MRIAVIPARGSSKRIPRKNIKNFHGKPIIAWSIEAAKNSDCFDQIIVSTDDDEIAAVARKWGADTPFVRPVKLSDDYATTASVIRHAVLWLEANGLVPELVCCIYATAPFLKSEDLKCGLELLLREDYDYVFSATTFSFPIQRAIRISSGGCVAMFQPEHFNTRSQDLEEAYHDVGQFYWGKSSAWKIGAPLFGDRSSTIIIPRERAQDIDTQQDWIQAEFKYEYFFGKK